MFSKAVTSDWGARSDWIYSKNRDDNSKDKEAISIHGDDLGSSAFELDIHFDFLLNKYG